MRFPSTDELSKPSPKHVIGTMKRSDAGILDSATYISTPEKLSRIGSKHFSVRLSGLACAFSFISCLASPWTSYSPLDEALKPTVF